MLPFLPVTTGMNGCHSSVITQVILFEIMLTSFRDMKTTIMSFHRVKYELFGISSYKLIGISISILN